jgi:hypothetical protein
LVLIFALAVGVTHVARLIPLEEENLGDSLMGINLGWQGCGVGDFESDIAFPARLKGSRI